MAYTYTKDEWASIVMEYNADTPLEILAKKYNKSVASIRMKLVKAGLYKKQKSAEEVDTEKVFAEFFNKFGPALL